jgi:hypothetical protein
MLHPMPLALTLALICSGSPEDRLSLMFTGAQLDALALGGCVARGKTCVNLVFRFFFFLFSPSHTIFAKTSNPPPPCLQCRPIPKRTWRALRQGRTASRTGQRTPALTRGGSRTPRLRR